MKITWHGHACFSITHDGYTVVIDPYNADYTTGYPKLRLKADKLLISHEHYGHNCREAVTLSGRPESDCPFEISTLEVSHDSVCGIMRGKCMIHILEVDGLKAVHMGDVGTPAPQRRDRAHIRRRRADDNRRQLHRASRAGIVAADGGSFP